MDMLDLALNPVKANRRFSPFSNKLPEGMVRRLVYNFGDRASADPNELFVASKDGSSPPAALRLALKRDAWAVVRAETRGDLFALAQFARENFIPIVPRGGGTSIYGGAVPTEGGVVVDVRGLDAIVRVDEANLTVTVEPGITLSRLDRALERHGLALRQTTTTARGSTVGGLVATGGGGIGSLKYGPFRNDVVAVELLRPDGSEVTLRGHDLDLVLGAWGITGFLVEVTLKVRKAAPITPFLAEWDDESAAAVAAARLAGSNRGYHLAFHPAGYGASFNEAAKTKTLPTKTSILFCVEGDVAEGEARFRAIVEDTKGTVAKPDAAAKSWAARFDHLNVKRLGPTAVIAEGVLDVARLGEALRAVREATVTDEQALWAHMVSDREINLVWYGLEEERRPEFAFAIGNGMAFVDAIRDLGGRPSNTGVLYSRDASEVLGEDRVKRLKAFKKEFDGNDVFNPGPVLGARMRGVPLLRMFPTFLAVNAPALKMLRGQGHYRGGAKQDPAFQAVRRAIGMENAGDLAEVDYEVQTCTFCAGCNDVAPESTFVHWETAMPRGRVQAARAILMAKTEPTPHLHEQAALNPLAYAPDAVCPTSIPIARVTDLVLAACVDRFGALPAHAALAQNAEKEGNVLGKPRDKRTAWAALPWDTEARTLFLADDLASYEAPDSASAAARVILNADVRLNHLGKSEVTSGATLVETGQRAAAAAVVADMLKAIASRKIDVVVSPDANAVRTIRLDWPAFAESQGLDGWNVAALHASEAVATYLKQKRLEVATPWTKKVVYHAPEALTADGRASGLDILKALGATVVPATENECGHGRGLDKHKPEMQQKIAERALRAALDAGAEAVVCSSPGCLVTLKAAAKKAKVALEVVDLLAVVATSMKVREGGGMAAPVAAPAEPEAAAEPEIPPDHYRVEFVKEKKVVAIHKNTNILDAALEAGMELPFSCRAGSCDTCSARWEGTPADQSAGAALTADQQKTFVLTCIARPRGPIKIWSDERP